MAPTSIRHESWCLMKSFLLSFAVLLVFDGGLHDKFLLSFLPGVGWGWYHRIVMMGDGGVLAPGNRFLDAASNTQNCFLLMGFSHWAETAKDYVHGRS